MQSAVIKQAESEGLIHPNTGSCIFEGTSGSTGISIAGIARARGYKARASPVSLSPLAAIARSQAPTVPADIVLPDDVAAEKIQMLRVLGAEVEPVRPVSIVDRRHYVNLARQRALEFGRGHDVVRSTTSASTPSATPRAVTPSLESDGVAGTRVQPDLLVTAGTPRSGRSADADAAADGGGYRDPPRGLFADQFENLSNLRAHSEGTAQEIWTQTAGRVDAFISGAGTGGTIAGVGRVLKERTGGVCEIVLADPQGSGLYHKVSAPAWCVAVTRSALVDLLALADSGRGHVCRDRVGGQAAAVPGRHGALAILSSHFLRALLTFGL